ncbi:MAG: universal stress protein [Marinobacterium sp.]|nr:universal stress protein [Marinobacterium sp.]
MYTTIICAIEVGDEGKKVLSRAKKIAKKFDSKLIVLSVLPYSLLPKDYQKELKENAIPEFEAFIAETGISKKNCLLKVGKPYEVICAMAEKKEAELIILGTHSRTGLSSMIGSTANAVANHAHCDVSLVKI